MWEKHQRVLVFSQIYAILSRRVFDLSAEIGSNGGQDLELFLNLNENSTPEDILLLQKVLKIFGQNLDSWNSQIAELLENWDKTYLIIKAILFCFLLETSVFKKYETATLITKYLRLTQDFVGSHGVSVVHAILAKLTGQGLPDKDKANQERQN